MSTSPLLLMPGNIITMDPARRVIRGGGVLISDGRILDVLDMTGLQSRQDFAGERLHVPDLLLIPGFVQTHIHLCQTLFRGLADDLDLIDWLTLRIFPFEAAHTGASMHLSAMLGIAECVSSGTTTIMDMGSIRHEDQIVQAVERSGLRACVGKSLMDMNPSCPGLRETTRDALNSAQEEARAWHGSAGGRIRYAASPRFVLSCTDQLLRGAWEMTGDFVGMLFHTHAAENRREMSTVQERCGMGNIEYFEHLGVLHAGTCLAHCVWISDREIALLAERNARVLHCPSSNLKLGSGIAPVPAMMRNGISVSLGADGAPCNNALNMFEEMRLAALIQKPANGPSTMRAEEVFTMATIGGATALGWEREIGSIEAGKLADLVLLDLTGSFVPSRLETPQDLYSAIVFSGSPSMVHSVMVDGRWLYRNHEFVALDAGGLADRGRTELRRLLDRVESR